jgi:biotin carboxylase
MVAEDTVVVIGGGHPQLCLIEELRGLGERVVVIDDRPHAPAHRIADEVIPIHRYDVESIVAQVRANPPDHVASGGSDQAVHIAAHLAETLGLPTYVNAATAELPMRKAAIRGRLAAAGIPCPATVYGTHLDAFRDLDWNTFTFPVVIKPDQGIGQTGVDRAENVRDALASIEAAFAATENGVVVLQELVQGSEIGVNGIVVSGRFHLLTTSYRRSSRERGPAFGVAMEKVFPAVTAPPSLDALSEIIQQACSTLAIDDGPIYAQVIMASDSGQELTFTIIEIMPRLGGGEDPRLVHAATGFNLAKATALMWLGRPVVLADLYDGPAHPAAVLRFLHADPGQVTTIKGIETARATPGVIAAEIFVHPGQHLGALSSSRERAGYTLATGQDPTAAAGIAATAAAAIIIETRQILLGASAEQAPPQ